MAHATTRIPDALAVLTSAKSLPLAAVLSVKFAACVTNWATRRRTRLTLRGLDDWQLRDVGLTPDAAHREAQKVFWRT